MQFQFDYKKMIPNLRYHKIILAGSGGVGKTAIRDRYMGKGFTNNYYSTLGADFAIKRFDNTLVQIWDVAGQPAYEFLRKEYYAGSQGVILVFDLSDVKTFERLHRWVGEIVTFCEQLGTCILVGNKEDLVPKGKPIISDEKITKFIQDVEEKYGLKMQYISSSAISGNNISEIFNHAIGELTNWHHMKLESPNKLNDEN